jgi:hypothetical protein
LADVFISYKRDERQRAESIASRLRTLGLDVWLDAHIASGRSFDAEIETALRAAKAVLVLWTPGSVASEWVRNEASAAKERGTLVALMLAPCELPIEFRAVQYEPLFEKSFADDHPSWVKVVERIKDLAGKREAVERESKRRIFRQKRNGILLWLLAWPFGALAFAIAGGALTASYGPTPQFGGFYADSWDSGYVAASGTWELEGEALAAPVNHIEITCQREEGYCIEARAELFTHGSILGVATDRRPIVSWTPDTITTRNDTGCGGYVMTISRGSESVTALEVNTPSSEYAGASIVPCNQRDPRKEFRLVDGGRRELDSIPTRSAGQQRVMITLLVLWSLFVGWRILRIVRRRRVTWA